MKWKLENDVNDYVKNKLEQIGLKKLKDFNEESAMSQFMKSSLIGSSKTNNKTGFGKPDFHIEKYKIPVIIENKLHIEYLNSGNLMKLKIGNKDIQKYAANGAVYYARKMIQSGKYNEVIAIGIAGDDDENVRILIFYVYGFGEYSYKYINSYCSLDFLENENSFNEFYKNLILNEEEKHNIIIKTKEEIIKKAKNLNKVFHNLNITAAERILYVSGCLLAMQDYVNPDTGEKIKGLNPDDLEGKSTKNHHDSEIIFDQIETFLNFKNVPENKRLLMLNSFSNIKKDYQRDEKQDPINFCKDIQAILNTPASINKQLFSLIYENIYLCIDGLGNNVDLIGELYSSFLKYAMGDGKEIGIVLTPPYITKLMVDILELDENSKVLDLATGSAGFLISSMNKIIEIINSKYGKNTTIAEEKIKEIKSNNLLGVELNSEMFALATTNMILRGDGSSKIEKGDAFDVPESLYKNFEPNRILLNPPFSYTENGLPFIKFGLDIMQKNGIAAIIIQDSAGNGKAKKTAQEILKKHTLIASIKMPPDLFIPNANVQTSIYIFKAHIPHDIEKPVKFIDFRNDGYKRTIRGIKNIDNAVEKYINIIKVYKAGKNANIDPNLFNINEIYIEDFISLNGDDWNFDQHVKFDTMPTLDDFKRIVGEYLSFEVNKILKGK